MNAKRIEQNRADRAVMVEAMKKLSESGYTCYAQKTDEFVYGFIITPTGNILNTYLDDYSGGWKFALEYQPSRENGSGCQCLADCVGEITEEIVKEAETAGLAFARQHCRGSQFYASPEAWLKSYWDKDNLEQI